MLLGIRFLARDKQRQSIFDMIVDIDNRVGVKSFHNNCYLKALRHQEICEFAGRYNSILVLVGLHKHLSHVVQVDPSCQSYLGRRQLACKETRHS